MIKNQVEYANALDRLIRDRAVLASEEREYREAGLSEDEVTKALEPHQSFHEQLKDEVAWYESVRRGEAYCIESLQDVGKMLVALRIMSNMTQREFALRLGVDESQVSRDERNEYYGVTVRRVEEIVRALGSTVQVTMEPPSIAHELIAVKYTADRNSDARKSKRPLPSVGPVASL